MNWLEADNLLLLTHTAQVNFNFDLLNSQSSSVTHISIHNIRTSALASGCIVKIIWISSPVVHQATLQMSKFTLTSAPLAGNFIPLCFTLLLIFILLPLLAPCSLLLTSLHSFNSASGPPGTWHLSTKLIHCFICDWIHSHRVGENHLAHADSLARDERERKKEGEGRKRAPREGTSDQIPSWATKHGDIVK